MARDTKNTKRILKERLASARSSQQQRARNEQLKRKFASKEARS
jgi:hypothetical protein